MTDTYLIDPLIAQDGSTVHPAHSWVIFGATDEESAVRVELVSPIINGVPHGMAISVTQLLGDVDIGEPTYHLTHTITRTSHTIETTTSMRNAEIFNPSPESGSGDAQPDLKIVPGTLQPVLRLACTNRMKYDVFGHDGTTRFAIQNSHLFVRALLSRIRLSSDRFNDIQVSGYDARPTAGANAVARWEGDHWAILKRFSSLTHQYPVDFWHQHYQLGGADLRRLTTQMTSINPVQHIFYEALIPRSRTQGAPRRRSFAFLYELVRWDSDACRARSIMSPWMDLIRASQPPTFRHGQSIVALSRDPRLTSGYLMPDVFGFLPLLLKQRQQGSAALSEISATNDAPPPAALDSASERNNRSWLSRFYDMFRPNTYL